MRNVVFLAVVVVVAVVIGMFAWQRRRPAARVSSDRTAAEAGTSAAELPARAAQGPGGPESAAFRSDLTRWVAAGLISAEQAEAITGFERAEGAWRGPAAKGRRVSLLAEALGYVGVVLVLAGAGVGLALSWEDLAVWARLLIPAGATALLVLGSFLLRGQREPAFRRLMSVLLMLAVGGAVWTASVLGIDVLELDSDYTAFMAAGAGAALAAALYGWQRHGLQLAVLWAAVHGLVVTGLLLIPFDDPATAWPDDIPVWWVCLAIWVLGLAWAALGWRNRLRPGWLAIGLGCLGAVIGPSIGLGEYEWLLAPGLLTAAGLMAVSVPARQTPLLALGTVGAFGYITWAVVHYFSDSLGVPVALVIVGAVFLALAVLAGVLATHNRKKEPAIAG